MAYRARKTEHCGAKKGKGAYWGHKSDAKLESNRVRREESKAIEQEEMREDRGRAVNDEKIVFASQSRLAAVDALAPRFFRQVLDLDYAECLTTDESDLCDYASSLERGEGELEAMLDRIETHYLVDCRAAGSTRIVDLLELLRSRGVIC